MRRLMVVFKGATQVFVLALVLMLSFAASTAWAAGKRVALVIGNGAYQTVPQLPNPKNDADLVSKTLRKQGFEVVTAIDLDRAGIENAVERFVRALNGAEISLFYYSGHAMEVAGENRVIPVDAVLAEPQDLETQTYSLQTILLAMQSNSQAQLLYLDACRDNPFADRAFLLGADDKEKPAGKGLAEQKGAIGSLIAYATEPGNVAQDGTGNNSPFTDAVIRHSFTQDADVQSALMKVTEEVWETTKQSQRPWINSTLVKPVFLNGLLTQNLAINAPPVTKTLAELQATETTDEVAAGPVTIGAGAQAVFDATSVTTLPPAEAYKLMQMPLTGTLSIDGEVLAEGVTVDAVKLRSLAFDPSTDVQVYRDANTAALLVPAVQVQMAAIATDGKATPLQIKVQQRMHECDLLAAEPLDLQGIGKGVELDEMDITQALAACNKAVIEQPQNTRYIYLLGRAELAAGNVSKARQLITQAADGGYVRANHQLGVMATNGIGMTINLELANEFFKLAADKGDPFGLLAYGRNLVKGNGLTVNVPQGLQLLKRAAELGNTDAFDEIGGLYLYGGALKASPKRAAGFLESSVTRSAKKLSKTRSVFGGNTNAATDLGKLYFTGEGLRQDLRQAVKWYEMGADLGNQGGTADLSWIFTEGPEDMRNPLKAVWFTSLALASDNFGGNADLLQRLALLPADAKRDALRNFVNLVGPCATQTSDDLDETLQLLARKTWAHRNAQGASSPLGYDGSFELPASLSVNDELRYWNMVKQADTDQAYLAYLEYFPNGVFADMARARLGGLLEQVAVKAVDLSCVPPKTKTPSVKKTPRKVVEPQRFIPPKPKPVVLRKPPVVKKPVVVVKPKPERPRKKPVIVVVPDREPEFEPDPVQEEPKRPKIKIKKILKKFIELQQQQQDDGGGAVDCRRNPKLCQDVR